MRAVESIGELTTRWLPPRDLYFEESNSPEVDLLIGCDVPEAPLVLDQRLGDRKEPYAARTIFGWTLFGPPHATNRKPLSVNFTINTAGNGSIEQVLQSMYDNEFDDLNDQKGGSSVEDNQALAIVETGTPRQPDRFEVPLPYRTGYDRLPNNHGIALKRLE
ncbi:unnamed protein product [Echinostoma caproni]|uniref:DUF1758 domain-containing protein n=1 Tax=Echinostoma caproni TaxID=27848 RepID=A0A183A156_9TREM|nr:unnamed protein product [Echinostoma caproni]